MRIWMVRGLVFAAAMVVLRLIQGALINAFQTMAGVISITLVLLFAIVVFIWGLSDGRKDAREQPDPDRRRDLAMVWLLTGLVAGVVSGFVTWLISLFDHNGLYTGGLINEVSTFAAFTALLVFLPAIGAVTLGRWLIDRKADENGRGSEGDEDRADTDVFDAVQEDETPAHGMPAAGGQDQERNEAGERTEERQGAVATAEREEPTEPQTRREEQGRAARGDEPTQVARGDDRTEELRTDDRTQPASTSDAEKTRPTRTSRDDQR